MNVSILRKYDFYCLIICLSLVLSGLSDKTIISDFFTFFIFIFLITFYFKTKKSLNRFLLYFFILNVLGEVFNVLEYYNCSAKLYCIISIDLVDISNSFFVLAYGALFFSIISRLNLKQVVKRLPVQILIMSAIGIYLFLKLNEMLVPYKGDLTEFELSKVEYTINVLYNTAILLVLGSSLLNYFFHDSKQALKLLIACVFIVFSEFLQLFVFSEGFLKYPNFVSLLFLAIGYYFIFMYLKAGKLLSMHFKKA